MSIFGARRERSAVIDLLPPEPGLRKRNAVTGRRKTDIVDAQFVVLAEVSGPARRPAFNDNRRCDRSRQAQIAAQVGRLSVGVVAWSVNLTERLLQLLPPRAFGAVVAGCFMMMFFLAGGLSALAMVLAGTGPAGTVEIASVSSSLDDRDGMKVLSVYGTIVNRSGAVGTVPTILVDVLAGGQSIARHLVEPERGNLPPGAVDTVSLKLAHGGASLPKIAVSLVPAGASER